MRFRTLKDLTSLPVERIRGQFRNEEVRCVLPARAAVNATEALLVATTTALAIVVAAPGQPCGRSVTRWAPWDVVRADEAVESTSGAGDGSHHLSVRVDRLRFDSTLSGKAGLKAMRDFIGFAHERRSRLAVRP
jgi:hypothetical protein